MPLLRKKVFEKHVEPDLLRDDEEVFYCEITNEIFRDYHDFSERMFLCNSMVWTCAMTGKSNLTYQEAVESEKHAVECLKGFPNELKCPILYLSTLTKRTFFGEMADDIFLYIKDRYFVGENLEACFSGNKWKDCRVISVHAPNEQQYQNEAKETQSKSPSERHFIPPAHMYKYEIEHLDQEDKDISEIMIIDNSQIKRKKLIFSKEKVKLFLKQNVEQDSRGVFVIKPTILEKYNIKHSTWETIFDGPLPDFKSSKNFEKVANGKKKHRQETMSKYLEKNGLTLKKPEDQEKKNNLLEQMRKREEEFRKQKLLNNEKKAMEKQKKKEESIELAQRLKDWSKHKEDLELEDHIPLPLPTPVRCRVPDQFFGDVLMILEFVNDFKKILSAKDFFPGGFSLEILERALIEQEVAGPLTDLIQMLLVAIFNCQEEEKNTYSTTVERFTAVQHELDKSTVFNSDLGIRLATYASFFAKKYHGIPISGLPLYPLTVSEVLRLHLLSSGARLTERGARWRYAQRGEYTSDDDPGLYMRLHQPQILKALAIHNVVQLSISDKMNIISCLMNQVLTYADVRDILEDSREKVRSSKVELKALMVSERKREVDVTTQKSKLKREFVGNPEGLKLAREKLEASNEKRQLENQKRANQLKQSFHEGQTLLGTDRAFRRYLRIESLPGLFVNWEGELAGSCLDKITPQYPELIDASQDQLIDHIRDIDKKKSVKQEETSPAKSPRKINGSRKSLQETEVNYSFSELLLCSADETKCPVHTDDPTRPKWAFFHKGEQLEELIKALNNRGIREGELKEIISFEKDKLAAIIDKTPVNVLNLDLRLMEDVREGRKLEKHNEFTKKKDRYDDANLGYPPEMNSNEVLENALLENILEMEEKVHAGGLGSLKIKDRHKWRTCLQNKNYEKFETILTVLEADKQNKLLKVDKNERSRPSTPDVPEYPEEEEKYYDPGMFLEPTIKSEDNLQATEIKKAIHCLAMALSHVADAVEARHLLKPLGNVDRPKSNKKIEKTWITKQWNVLSRWKQSLIASTSFSQVFLHYGTLDSCVMWSRSALLARCQICRRQRDSENMLLCDSCNLGHHMYCLKPKLRAVPKGDWFCLKCIKEKEKEEKLLSPEPVKKRRRIFVEEEEEEHDSGNEVDEEDSNHTSDDASESDDSSKSHVDLCKTCGSGGEILQCEVCKFHYHKECVNPPLRRIPRTAWKCPKCSNKGHSEVNGSHKHRVNGYGSGKTRRSLNLAGITYSQRRCAAKASRKIHAFAKVLRLTDPDSESLFSDDDESDEEVLCKRVFRRNDQRDDLPLHNVALQELLSDIMKHEAAWPFLRPVQQKEVPDYYQIIKNPMDFGTIKYKLNMGKYSTDSQLMKDVVLVFDNCSTYNSSTDEVYQCGVQLTEYLCKKAYELGLEVPTQLGEDIENEPANKKRRLK